MKHDRKNILKLLAKLMVIAAVISGICALVIHFSNKPASAGSVNTEALRTASLIKNLESADFAPIEDKIFEAKRSAIVSNDIDTENAFLTLSKLDTVYIGDSRVVGFSSFGYVDASRVLANTSWSILEIPAVIPALDNINPKNIIVSFGLNEIGHQLDTPVYYTTNELYVSDLSKYLHLIQEHAPNAKIYFSSIMPVTEATLAASPGFSVIPGRNEAIKAMCKQEGFGYIDMTETANSHKELYHEDGIHFQSEFYPYWGAQILDSILYNETGGRVDSMTDDEVWAKLQEYNVVISGDSRGAEFSAFDFYPFSLNLSNYSRTIYNIPETYDGIASIMPRNLVLCFGVNDLGLYSEYGVEQYTSDLLGFVDTIRQLSPATKVYVNSIPPSLPSEYSRAPSWALAYPWNEYIENVCKENGIYYINITDICDAHPELYRGDGVHFKPDFYPLWARAILKEVIKHES